MEGVTDSMFTKNKYYKLFFIMLASSIITLIGFEMVKLYATYDLTVYFGYLENIRSGMTPYSDFSIEYPQLFLLFTVPQYALACLTGNSEMFFIIFIISTIIIYYFTVVLIYKISDLIWNDERRAYTSALLFSTSIACLYFATNKYDIFPVFLMLWSLYMIMNRGEHTKGYIIATFGVLTKWFNAVIMPFYIIKGLKDRKKISEIARYILACCGIGACCIIPFVIMNFEVFWQTYAFHFGRGALTHSFPYMVQFYLGISASWFNVIFIVICVYLLYKYYKSENTNYNLLKYVALIVTIFVFCNKVFSPQYILWFAPFLALMFVNNKKEIFVYYLAQVVVLIEFPILVNKIYMLGDYMTLEGQVWFIFKWIVMFVVLWMIVKNDGDGGE